MHQQPPIADRTAGLELPLVAIEHYMLADDRADHPMAFYVRLTLDRLPQREAFQRAVGEALAGHPLLTATVTQAQGRRRWWTWQRPATTQILWPGDPTSQQPLDLTCQSGLRIRFEALADGARMTLQFHHACCDGLGALKFTGDLLSAYGAQHAEGNEGQRHNPDSPLPTEEDVRRLRMRGRCGVGPIHFLLRLPLELLGALGVVEFLWHQPAALGGSAKTGTVQQHGEQSPLSLRVGGAETSHWPSRYAHEFTVEETSALRAAASAAGATLNDLLVRDLFLTTGEWIDQQVPSRRGAHVRVMVPVNLRTEAEQDLSAANVVAMINLDRRPRRWRNHRRMLRVLHWEMAAVKWARLGLTFIRAIQVTHYLMGRLQLLLAADQCQATCVLSNLGDPWRGSSLTGLDGRILAGDVTVRQLEMLPPIRPLTRVSIGAITYARRLTIALNCDQNVLTADECHALRERYVAALKRSLE